MCEPTKPNQKLSVKQQKIQFLTGAGLFQPAHVPHVLYFLEPWLKHSFEKLFIKNINRGNSSRSHTWGLLQSD